MKVTRGIAVVVASGRQWQVQVFDESRSTVLGEAGGSGLPLQGAPSRDVVADWLPFGWAITGEAQPSDGDELVYPVTRSAQKLKW